MYSELNYENRGSTRQHMNNFEPLPRLTGSYEKRVNYGLFRCVISLTHALKIGTTLLAYKGSKKFLKTLDPLDF